MRGTNTPDGRAMARFPSALTLCPPVTATLPWSLSVRFPERGTRWFRLIEGNVAASVLVCAAAERLICDCTTWSAAPLWEVVMPVFSADI
jgi:hypothetical protein